MSSSQQLGDTLGHPEEKTRTGKFVDKITGADKAEKLIDTAFNYLAGNGAHSNNQQAATAGGASTGTSGSSATGTSNSHATPAPHSSQPAT